MSKKQPQTSPNANGKLVFRLKILLIAILLILFLSGLTRLRIQAEANCLTTKEVEFIERLMLELCQAQLKITSHLP